MAQQKEYKGIAEYKHLWYMENRERILNKQLQKDAKIREQKKRRENCPICKHDFYTSKDSKKYCSSQCSRQGDLLRSKTFGDENKPSKREYDKAYRITNDEKVKKNGRKGHIKRNYGMTDDDYNSLLNAQDGRCAICKTHQSEFGRMLHIDHDHITGKVRGLLCFRCNSGLGFFRDNCTALLQAVSYLKCSDIKEK
jgi:hypothetical protein